MITTGQAVGEVQVVSAASLVAPLNKKEIQNY